MKGGKYDKDGELQPVSWDRAFDVMAEQFKKALKDKGHSGVAARKPSQPSFSGRRWMRCQGCRRLRQSDGDFPTL